MSTQLKQVEIVAQQLINTPKLQSLLGWANQVTAGLGGGYTPIAKRAAAIYLLLDRDRAFTRIVGHNRVTDLSGAIDATLTLACTLGIDFKENPTLAHARSLNSDPCLARELYLALYRNRDFDLAVALYRELVDALNSTGIFSGIDFDALIARLEGLRNQGEQEVDPNCYQNVWLNAFCLDLDWLALSKEEANALLSYLCANKSVVYPEVDAR